MKICTSCNIEKPFTEFSKNSRRKDGLQANCKECNRLYHLKRKAEAPELIRLRHVKYRQTYRAEILARKAKYRSENKEKIKAYYTENRDRHILIQSQYRLDNSERVRSMVSEWKSKNPELVSSYGRKRRALIAGAEGSHSAGDVIAIFEKQGGMCAACNAKLVKSGKNKYHVDHIMPLAKGGSNWPSNLQCLCPSCNLSKGAKDPLEWAAQNGRLI